MGTVAEPGPAKRSGPSAPLTARPDSANRCLCNDCQDNHMTPPRPLGLLIAAARRSIRQAAARAAAPPPAEQRRSSGCSWRFTSSRAPRSASSPRATPHGLAHRLPDGRPVLVRRGLVRIEARPDRPAPLVDPAHAARERRWRAELHPLALQIREAIQGGFSAAEAAGAARHAAARDRQRGAIRRHDGSAAAVRRARGRGGPPDARALEAPRTPDAPRLLASAMGRSRRGPAGRLLPRSPGSRAGAGRSGRRGGGRAEDDRRSSSARSATSRRSRPWR